MSRLVLIDGFSYLYCVFYVLLFLFNVQGEFIGVLFGVVNMLCLMLKECLVYVVFVVDVFGKIFCDDLYGQYKVNCLLMFDELCSQVELMCCIVEVLGISILCIFGVEVDDVIGMLVLQGLVQDLKVIIFIGDKDFVQLVCLGIELVNIMIGSCMDFDVVVMDKFGVCVDQIVDLLVLMGDVVDNVLGVEKCGLKIVVKWLVEYQYLDGVMVVVLIMKGKIGENLCVVLECLLLNCELVIICIDVELEVSLISLVLCEQDVLELIELYMCYGFIQVLKELGVFVLVLVMVSEVILSLCGIVVGFVCGSVEVFVVGMLDLVLFVLGEYEIVLIVEQLQVWVECLQQVDLISFDIEIDVLDVMCVCLVGISLVVELGRVVYILVGYDYLGVLVQLLMQQVLDVLCLVLQDLVKKKLGQYGKYDLYVLCCYGVDVWGYYDDIMFESFVFNFIVICYDMDLLVLCYLGYSIIKFEDVVGKGVKQILFLQVGIDEVSCYVVEDVDIILCLYCVLQLQLLVELVLDSVYCDIEMLLVLVLVSIEVNGVWIDIDELCWQSQDLFLCMLVVQQKVIELVGCSFNLDLFKQLQVVLFDELKLLVVVKILKGQFSINEEVLEVIVDQYELSWVIFDYRGLVKLCSIYIDKLLEMVNLDIGWVYISYYQFGVVIGCLFLLDLNLQNILICIEDGCCICCVFIVLEGCQLLVVDYLQIELRIMVYLFEDLGLVCVFEQGVDVYCVIVVEVFGCMLEEVILNECCVVKVINFGLMYGMSVFGLVCNLGIDRGQVQDYVVLYFSCYLGVCDFMEWMCQQVCDQGYVEILFGCCLYLNDIYVCNQGLCVGVECVVINVLMQGIVVDIIKCVMVDVDQWLCDSGVLVWMILQVYDELVFEIESSFVEDLCLQVVECML